MHPTAIVAVGDKVAIKNANCIRAAVTLDVEHALVMDRPARRAGWVSRCGRRLDVRGDAFACPECGRTHRLDGDRLVHRADDGAEA